MLSVLKDKKKVVGSKQAKRFLAKGTISLLYVAKDADRKITDELVQMANEKSVEVVFIENMKELGEACGIDVCAAVVSVLK